jgi:serine/threonine-protein kinase
MTNEGIHRAIGCFQSALVENPTCALVKTGLADAYCQLALSGTACTSEVSPPARQFASDALRTQPSLAEAHISMGQVRMLFDWDWNKATEDWNHASRLDPSQPEAHRAWARLLAARNCHTDALREISRAQDLAPLSLPIGFEHAWLLYLAGNFREAAAESWKVLSLEPAFAPAQTILGLAYQQLGSFDEAITELENACTCSQRQPSALASLGHAYAAAGLPDKARDILAALAAESQLRHISAYCFALVHVGLGQLQLAIDALQMACTQRDPQLLWLNVDPRFASLHSAADFVALSRHLKLTAD